MLRNKFFIATLCGIFSLASIANAQETKSVTKDVKTPTTNLTLDAQGNLVGKVVAEVNGKKQPVEAKMSLIRNGKVVKTVFADENGSFSFGGIAPGKYAVSGSAATYVGMQPVAVVAAPTSITAVAPTPQLNNTFTLQTPSIGSSYSSFPAASFSGGAGFRGGGFSGGRFGGRLLGNRRLLRLGVVGGVVAIAVGNNDASPTR